MSKTIPQLGITPSASASLLWLEVAREISAGVWNGVSERIQVATLVTLLADAGAAINLNLIQQLNPTGAAYSATRTYTLYDYLDVPYQGGHYAYIGIAPASGHAPPDPAYWVLISEDGLDGVSAIATVNATAPNTPAVGSSATYTVNSSAGHGVNQYAAIAGISGVFLVSAIASGTTIALRNESAPVGTAVAIGAKIIPAGKPGATGAAGAVGPAGAVGDKGDKGDRGDPGPTGAGGGASGLQYTYNTTAGTGVISAADLSTATTLTLGTPDAQGKVVSDVLARLKVGAIIEVAKDGANRIRYAVTSDHASGSVGVAVAAVYGAIASGDTVYLAIVSPVPSASDSKWIEYTASTQNVAPNSKAIANRATVIELVLPSGAIGETFSVAGKGAGIYSLIGATFYRSDGTSGTGLRRLAANRYAVIDLVCIEPLKWVVQNPANFTGIEFFTAPLPDPLAGLFTSFWKLDEASGNRLDSIGSNTLTPFNNPTSGTGLIGDALYVANSAAPGAQCLEIDNNASFNLGVDVPLVITAAVYISSTTGFQMIFSKYDNDGVNVQEREWYFVLDSGNFSFGAYDTTVNSGILATMTATPNAWNILVGWFDPVANTVNLSVNGAAANTQATSASFSIRPSVAKVRIGCAYLNRRYGTNGRVDCVGFGKTVPTADQIAAIYNGGLGYQPA